MVGQATDGAHRSQATKVATISVVLPCLNEAESVGACVNEALTALADAGFQGEVIVTDNGSTDGSAAIAAAHGARVVYEPVPGYGSALQAGIRAAEGDIVVMADADFTYDLTKIPLLVQPLLDDEADLVLGQRLDDATKKSMPFLHRFVGTPTLSFLVRRACGGLDVTDSQSGFRAFRREEMLAIGVHSTGMEFASEMLIRAAARDLRVTEVNTGYRERIGDSKLNTFADGWRHLHLILLLAPHLLLVWPGAILLALGIVLSVATLISPSGLSLGSLDWQPVFFSGILLVLGAEALLAGSVIAERSSVVTEKIRRRFRFVEDPRFTTRCLVAGVVSFAVGLTIDVVLFVLYYIVDEPNLDRGPALASLAQSLIVLGVTFAAFAVLFGLLTRGAAVGVEPEPRP